MDLYVCHTSYQLMIALVRAWRQGGGQSILLSKKVPGGLPLWQRIQESGAFDEVAVVDEEKWPGIARGLFARWKNKRGFEKNCGWYLKPGKYRDIYICNDWSVIGRYLQDCRYPYILCEDTIGSTLHDDQSLVWDQRKNPPKDYQYWGDYPLCKMVESEDADQCSLFPREKMVTFSKRELLASLTAAEKEMLQKVFITQPLPSSQEAPCLLLPRSFVLDGLMDQETQDRLFRAVAEKYCTEPLFIKTHPRDETDYQALFPRAVVLDRTMPSEILNFCLPFRFSRAVTVQSWALEGFTAADENIRITLEDAMKLISR